MQHHLFLFFLVAFLTTVRAATFQATLNITDSSSPTLHVHDPGSPFTLIVTASYGGPDSVYYQWLDCNKQPLSAKQSLPTDTPTNVESPDGDYGYVELCFTADPSIALPDRNASEPRSYGFFIATPRNATTNPTSYFGIVHAYNVDDPYIPSFIKNIWWAGTSPRWWGPTLVDEANKGKLEIGIFAQDSASTPSVAWITSPDDTVLISSLQLDLLANVSRQYMVAYANGANAGAAYVELGIEENLGANFYQTHFFENLASKARTVRQAAQDVGASNVKLIYQIVGASAGDNTSALYKFLSSPAAQYFDVLSLHVYAWPDFPSPETYVDELIRTTKAWMQKFNQVKSIQYTECGLPINDPFVTGFEDGGNPVPGSSNSYAASYMIKLNIMSIALGVERLFWYQYQNTNNRWDAEANFGMKDYQGFPLPMYASMWLLSNLVDGKEFVEFTNLPGNVYSYHFADVVSHVFVLWTYPNGTATTTLDSIMRGLTSSRITQCSDKGARPYALSGESVVVTPDPIFLVASASGGEGSSGADKLLLMWQPWQVLFQ